MLLAPAIWSPFHTVPSSDGVKLVRGDENKPCRPQATCIGSEEAGNEGTQDSVCALLQVQSTVLSSLEKVRAQGHQGKKGAFGKPCGALARKDGHGTCTLSIDEQ